MATARTASAQPGLDICGDALSSMHEFGHPYIASLLKVQRGQMQAKMSLLPHG